MFNPLLLAFLLVAGDLSAQSHRLDSLKKGLTGLHDQERVDCLNAIGGEYNFNSIRSDSALTYADLAYREALTIGYKRGQALALLTRGDVEGRLLGNMEVMERKSKQAIALMASEKDRRTLSLAWYTLTIAYTSEGKYDSALDAAANARRTAAESKDRQRSGWAIEATGLVYCLNGEYWKCFQNMIESQQTGKEINDSLLASTSLAFIGRAFNRVGDARMAISYYHQSLQYATSFVLLWPHMEDMAYAFLQLKQFDSALYYQQKHRHNLDSLIGEAAVRSRFNGFFWGNSVEVQLARKNYTEVLADILPLMEGLRKKGDVIPLMQSLLILGRVYEAKKSDALSFQYARELLQTAEQASNMYYTREASQLMASLYDHTPKTDSAYFYFRQYTTIKDAMDTAQFAQRTALYLAAAAAGEKIGLLKKDQTIKTQFNNMLVAALLVLLLLSLLAIRNTLLKRKNEQLKNEQLHLDLKHRAMELEMQALRAQMNPHFIFNCLSAIDNLIQINQPDKATSYLARFANLIRRVLDSSKNNLVPFQKDFETLDLYLEMEQFRCSNKFTYTIIADPELLHGDYAVPPLISQPFVENAIHHGLLNKQDADRQLVVAAELKNQQIIYSIVDNGVGRTRAAFLKQRNRPDQQSYGISISRDRIQLHNGLEQPDDIRITDLYEDNIPSGTRVEIRIRTGEL